MKRGFSLVEMMIALALTAVAITLMSEGVRRAIDFEQRLTEVRQQRDMQTATLDAVRARLEQLLPAVRPAVGSDDDSEEILFRGGSRDLVFVAADPGYPSIAGLYEYRFVLTGNIQPDDDAQPDPPRLTVFRRRLTDLEAFNTESGEPEQSWELPLPSGLEFGYGTHTGGMSGSWNDRETFPTIITLSGDSSEFPALTVALPRPRPEIEEAAQ